VQDYKADSCPGAQHDGIDLDAAMEQMQASPTTPPPPAPPLERRVPPLWLSGALVPTAP